MPSWILSYRKQSVTNRWWLTRDAKVIGISEHFLGKAAPLLGNLSNLVLAICREYLTSAKKTQVWLTFKIIYLPVIMHVMMITSNVPTCHADIKFTPPTPTHKQAPRRGVHWAMIFYWTGLLVGCRKISQILQDFQGKIHIKNQLISWKVSGKFRWKMIGKT